MTFQLFSAPDLHLPNDEGKRHSTWLEAFYDLVFVTAISALSTRLSHATSLLGAIQSLGLFLVVWWAWLGHTVYDTRFDTNDLFQRLLTIGIMIAAATMAVAIPRTFEGISATFALAYVGARTCLLVLYIRAWYTRKDARKIIAVYLIGFSVGVGLWVISVFVPEPLRYAFWSAGLLIDFLTPWFGLPVLRNAPVDTSHLPERLALFTLIILGEIVSVLVLSISTEHVPNVTLVVALITFCFPTGLWWSYFTFMDAAPFVPNLSSGQPYIYVHLPLYVGLTLTGVGLERVISEASSPALHLSARLLLGSGLLLWLGAMMLLKLVSLKRHVANWVFIRYSIMALGVTVLIAFGDRLPPLPVISCLASLLVVFVAVEARHWSRWSQKHKKAQGVQE